MIASVAPAVLLTQDGKRYVTDPKFATGQNAQAIVTPLLGTDAGKSAKDAVTGAIDFFDPKNLTKIIALSAIALLGTVVIVGLIK